MGFLSALGPKSRAERQIVIDIYRKYPECVIAFCVVMLFATCMNTTGNPASPGQPPFLDVAGRVPSISASAPPGVDYAPMPLEKLIGTADLIVVGTVTAVGDEGISIRVDESLQQQPAASSIVVKREEHSEIFAPRTAPYAKGQQFVFFLAMANGSTNGMWSIIGYPIAGELPVEGEFVYFDSYDIKEFAFETFEVHGAMRKMQRFRAADFKDAVRSYRNCFAWTRIVRKKNNRIWKRLVPARVCDEASLQNYKTKSQIHQYLTRMTTKQIPHDG